MSEKKVASVAADISKASTIPPATDWKKEQAKREAERVKAEDEATRRLVRVQMEEQEKIKLDWSCKNMGSLTDEQLRQLCQQEWKFSPL